MPILSQNLQRTAEFFRFAELVTCLDRYALGKKLGEGAFGQVRLATEIATKKDTLQFAIVRSAWLGSHLLATTKHLALPHDHVFYTRKRKKLGSKI